MSALRNAMPGFARHEGVWEGTYRHYDGEGRQVDEHRSRLVCRIPDGGDFDYLQTNHYAWADGRTEVPLDEHRRTMLLHWLRKGEPDLYLCEMIQISDCGRHRTRVWQWLRDGRCVMRTLIDEQKVADDWTGQ